MRLSRNVVVPAKLSFQFGRHGVIKTSNTWLDKVSFEVSDVWPESIVQCRGKSMTASVPSDASKTRKAGKRVPKDVRKSMVEKYVDNYRTLNAGKFPTVSDAKKNVGGCYYVVRQILQELEYNSSLNIGLQEVSRTRKPEEVISSVKHSFDVQVPGSDSRSEADSFDTQSVTKLDMESGLLTMNVDTSSSPAESDSSFFSDIKRKTVFVGKKVVKEKPLSEAEELSSSYATVDESILNLQTEQLSSLNIELEEEPQSLNSLENDKSKDGSSQSHRLMDDCEGSMHRDNGSPETNLKETASDDFLKYNVLNPDDNKQKSRILEIHEWESHKVPAPATEPENKPSMWQNLKSFANALTDSRGLKLQIMACDPLRVLWFYHGFRQQTHCRKEPSSLVIAFECEDM
ncbi:hypothetical protein F511_12529 [Dorcoceras hygrometricum]|uniref:AT3G52170-like helix-turn-helix domain-containing protein n=1 Tax=Dorcoceras hygrometricum TaxID=472368 RepID=A0A2Z7DIU3_9LAMI|nr:hypothetical protein F511_12529 [Dorcoceras hygrometricum]